MIEQTRQPSTNDVWAKRGSLDDYHQSQEEVDFSSRRLNRKLPPKLTESLEQIVLLESAKEVSANKEVEGAGYKVRSYSLQVDLPLIQESESPRRASDPIEPAASTKTTTNFSKPLIHTPPRFDTYLNRSHTAHTLTEEDSCPCSPTTTNMSRQMMPPSLSWASTRPSESTFSIETPTTCDSNSCYDEHTYDAIPRKKETRREKSKRKAYEKKNFTVDQNPSLKALFDASLLEVIDEKGNKVRFADLVRRRKTIVVFIRHWFCPLCAQYMDSILANVTEEALDLAEVDLVIIGNGSDKMIHGYRNKAFGCPFKMYTDPTLQLYRTLGFTQTSNPGPDSEKGDYIVQNGLQMTKSTLIRATKMPIYHNFGSINQVGGEMIFESPYKVLWTHRMDTTRSHASVLDVCEAAGVRLEHIHYEPGSPPPPVHRRSFDSVVDEDEDQDQRSVLNWREERDSQLDRIRLARENRKNTWSPSASGANITGRFESVRITA